MQAKLKDTYRFGRSMLAFNRNEYLKGEWRAVPAGYEKQAEAHEWLDVREDVIEETPVEPTADAILTEALEGETPTADKVLAESLYDGDTEPDPAEEETAEEEAPKQKRSRGGRNK